jgi:hypothetical protein
METTYYFDMLPVRPPVEPFESLTSYLTRLAQENGISSVDGLAALCFPNQDRRISRNLADYPPTSFEIVEILGVNKTVLSGTTFFHLGVKFGRSPKPQSLSRFLAGSVATYLRYCPHCLAAQCPPYYSLLWRFLEFRCCTIHHCELLDRCGQCDAKIPLLAAPLKIGRCPLCAWDLKMCRAKPSPEVVLSETRVFSQNIEFLLSPLQSDEMKLTNLAQRIGLRFKHLRKVQGFTALEGANRISVTLSVIEGIERGNVQGRGAKFQNYVRYAQLFGVTLQYIVADALQGASKEHYSEMMYKGYPICPSCRQNNFVVKFGHNHSGSQRYRCQSCQRYFTLYS